MLSLKGKKAVVIGGSGLLGSAIYDNLVEAGAKTLRTYCHNKPDNNAAYLDVLDKSTYFAPDPFHVLVLAHGINKPNPLDKITLADWQEIIAVNLTGVFSVVQFMLPFINNGGSIIILGSVSGHIGGPTTSHYTASKSGLKGFSENIALFAASKQIRCNLLSPGYIESEMASGGAQSQAVRDTIAKIPLGRMGTAEDVAGAALWLASDLSAYVTGQTIHVNGGLYW